MKTTSINLNEFMSYEYPIIILGSGLAGLLAAIRAARLGENVAIITKQRPGKASNTGFSMGYFSAAGTEMTREEHYWKSLETGQYLNDKKLLEIMTLKAPEVIECMSTELNLTFSPQKTGYVVADGEKPLAGANLAEKIVIKAMEHENIDFYPECLPIELLVKDGTCGGVLALDKEGEVICFRSKALLLATGGFAGAFEHTDNLPSMMGEGKMLGYRVGGALRDLEFIQFYPLGFKEEGLPDFIAPPRYPSNSKIYNDSGEDVILKYLGEEWDVNSATLWRRDRLSYAIEKEWLREQVWMDLTECEEDDWKGVNSKPLYDRYRFDFNNYPFRVRPTAHFTPGGISIDPSGRTGIKGLFAAGEVTGGVHGADRMGGNGLTEAACFGYMAGKEMVKHAPRNEYILKEENIVVANPLFSMYIDGKFYLPTGLKDENTLELKARIKRMFSKSLNPLIDEKRLESTLEELYEFHKVITPAQSIDGDSGLISPREVDKLKDLATTEMASSLLELCIESSKKRVNFKKNNDNQKKNIFWQQGKIFYRYID